MFSTIPNLISRNFGNPPTVCSFTECFTTTCGWYCCPGTFCVEVVLVGGGGGGGSGVLQCSLNKVSGGAGGGAGAVATASFTSNLNPACGQGLVTVGSGGAGGPDRCSNIQGFGNPGCPGGASCFLICDTANSICVGGGFGGCGGYSSGVSVIRAGGAGGGGGSPAGGTVCLQDYPFENFNGAGGTVPGKPGGGGAGFGINYSWTCYGGSGIPAGCGGIGNNGGGPFLGINLSDGGAGGGDFQCGSSSTGGFGGGGGGGAGYANTNPAGRGFAGGAGAPGIVKVTQYYIG